MVDGELQPLPLVRTLLADALDLPSDAVDDDRD